MIKNDSQKVNLSANAANTEGGTSCQNEEGDHHHEHDYASFRHEILQKMIDCKADSKHSGYQNGRFIHQRRQRRKAHQLPERRG